MRRLRDRGEELRKAFGARLGVVRRLYGESSGTPDLSRTKFARALGLEPETYRRYERGEANPTLETLVKLYELTHISLHFLITGDDEAPALRPGTRRVTKGDRLRWAREVQGHTAEETARLLRVPLDRWEDYEQDRVDLKDLELLEEFAHRFNVSIDFLQQGRLVGIGRDALAQLLQHHPELEGGTRSSANPGNDIPPNEDGKRQAMPLRSVARTRRSVRLRPSPR